ncbi:helix-turn-helix domain-containing protein [Corynebacterium cystitidis]|uniref:Transcriptional regulator, y4mF family n=1 Tax=Corynebacterium cystitidis DSM 20524 TaxID=1121357 RepID=A0A1H9VMQ3_9CORY|nr:helix-turn-helix domain-containing protein [Corynebacterium cystitidis]WJY82898.1 DNA-binding transcriptional repressor PuuR [Corynebacterium cystitidis DSM 20524]SES22882.1 transcriptional regulator, y4mF family [Corynebacterium cystitidis DSM 20524]SNV69299.1 predicted transcriptional regulator [Corynebacterium cystitidis]
MAETRNDVAVNVGKIIYKTRKTYNLTQVQLSELAGLSDKTVRDIEHGTGSPSLNSVLTVLDVLGLSFEVTS